MTDTRDKIIEQLQQLAVLHFLADPDMPDGSDPVMVLASARKALGAETWESLNDAAERVTKAHADKLAEIEANAAREGLEAAELLGEEMGRTANREAQIVALEKELAERIAQEAILRGDLADACRDASAPMERAPWPDDAEDLTSQNTPPKGSREGGIDSPEALRESVRIVTRQRDEASAAADRIERERDMWRELVVERTGQADSLCVEVDAAWRAYPSRGSVRGMVSLADVIEGLVTERDGLRAELAAALRPDGWECTLSMDALAEAAYHACMRTRNGMVSTFQASAEVVRDLVLANLRRKAAGS